MFLTPYKIFNAVSVFLTVLDYAIFIYCILTWVAPRSSVCQWLARFIDPFVSPFRTLSYKLRSRWGAPLDFSCFFALIAVQILQRLLWVVYRLLFMR